MLEFLEFPERRAANMKPTKDYYCENGEDWADSGDWTGAGATCRNSGGQLSSIFCLVFIFGERKIK